MYRTDVYFPADSYKLTLYLLFAAHSDDGFGYETAGDRGLPQWTTGIVPHIGSH